MECGVVMVVLWSRGVVEAVGISCGAGWKPGNWARFHNVGISSTVFNKVSSVVTGAENEPFSSGDF